MSTELPQWAIDQAVERYKGIDVAQETILAEAERLAKEKAKDRPTDKPTKPSEPPKDRSDFGHNTGVAGQRNQKP